MRLLIIGFWLSVVGLLAGGNGLAVADPLKVPSGCIAADGSEAGPHGYADRVIHEKTGIEMILLPAGTFTMGTDDPITGGNLTARQVTITRPFYVGKTEVTNGQYRRFIKARPDYKGEAEAPNLKPDDYYLIGIDKDDETGIVTIWSKRIAISRGENRVELSSKDVVWPK